LDPDQNADPDKNADPDPDSGTQENADRDPGTQKMPIQCGSGFGSETLYSTQYILSMLSLDFFIMDPGPWICDQEFKNSIRPLN